MRRFPALRTDGPGQSSSNRKAGFNQNTLEKPARSHEVATHCVPYQNLRDG